MKKNSIALSLLLFVCAQIPMLATGEQKKATLVVSSFDRPLQLFAFLESTEKYISDIDHTSVVYRTSTDEYAQAYDEVFAHFPWAQPIKQGPNPHVDFKPLLLKAVFEAPEEYIIFAVDDIVVKNTVALSECICALETTGAYGFYLRLGTNLNYCYALNLPQSVPPLTEVLPGIYSWRFCQAEHDWAYPHTVDMTLFAKKDIAPALCTMHYRNPNTFEANWSGLVGTVMRDKSGLCYTQSKIVTMPLNLVQTEYNNRHMEGLSAQELLAIFKRGLKMDIVPLHTIENKAAHMEYAPTFITR